MHSCDIPVADLQGRHKALLDLFRTEPAPALPGDGHPARQGVLRGLPGPQAPAWTEDPNVRTTGTVWEFKTCILLKVTMAVIWLAL